MPGILGSMHSEAAEQPKHGITITEIAELAGVSIATVSRVLNNNPHVRRENIEKVERVLAQYDYVPSRDRHPNKGSTTIGIIVPDIANPWFPSLIKGVENISRLHELNLVLSDSENDPDVEAGNIETMVERGVAGLILVPTSKHNRAAIELVDDGFPVVFLDRRVDDREINFVTSDNTEGAYQATKYLINLGHKHIVYVAGSEQIDTEWKRRDGYLKALEEAGIKKNDALIIRGNYDLQQANSSISDLVREGARFTAVFASDDIMAYGARLALNKYGLSVPHDVSLIGFDDIVFSPLLGLTTVAQSPFELGKNAVLLLNDILAGRVTGPKTVELATSMVIRDSCRPVTSGGKNSKSA